MALTTIDDRGLKTPIDLLDNEKIRFGTGNDLEVFHDGSNSYIKEVGTGQLMIQADNLILENAAGANYLVGMSGGEVILYHNDQQKFETTSAGVSVTGDFSTSGDVKITGDGAGCKLEIGASSDLQAYHNGGHNYLDSLSTAELRIRVKENESAIIAKPDGTVELYYDGTKKLETGAYGVIISGHTFQADNYQASFGSSDDLKIYHDGSNSYLDNDTGNLFIRNDTGGGGIYLRVNQTEAAIAANKNGAVELYYDNSNKLQTISTGVQINGNLNVPTGDVQLNDNKKLRLGNSQDLDIYHDGTNTHLNNGTGGLYIRNENIYLRGNATDEVLATFNANGSVDLYHNNFKSFNTTDTGIHVWGPEGTDSQIYMYADDGDDNADKWRLSSTHVGNMFTLETYASGSWVKVLSGHDNASLQLHYAGNKKLETISTGIKVTGESGAGTGVIQLVHTDGRKNSIGTDFASNAYDSRIEFGISDGSTNGGTNRVASISYAGISFGSDTASANRLDDYEEGHWTPSWKGNTNHGTTAYSTNTATYTKIGNLVRVGGYTQISGNSGGSGAWIIDNLPFANPNELSKITTGSCMMEANQDNDGLWLVPYKNANSSQIFFYYTRDDASWFTFDLSDDTTFNIIWGITYQV